MAAAGGPRRGHLRAVQSQEELRGALHGDQLVLHYQPIVSLRTGRMQGAEALLRWHHPAGALLLPDDFLPVVAHAPLMREITRWVLHRACTQATSWDRGTVSVNVSAQDVCDPALVHDVTDALAASGLAHDRLILELTEHSVVQDLASAITVLAELRTLGVGLSLDDFGTGYSSLFYLRELPLTEIKIDRIFISRVLEDPQDAAIVDSVVRLGTSVGLHVVAEGVETHAHARHLQAISCPAAQGYLWARPVPDPRPYLDRLSTMPALAGPPVPTSRPPSDLAAPIRDRILELFNQGASLHTIAAALNRDDIRTPHNTQWRPRSVAEALTHLEPASQPLDRSTRQRPSPR